MLISINVHLQIHIKQYTHFATIHPHFILFVWQVFQTIISWTITGTLYQGAHTLLIFTSFHFILWHFFVRLFPQPWTPDHVCDNWAEVIPVPHAAAECYCATWQCHVCVGNCSGFNRTGWTVLYLGLNCCYLVHISIDKK